MRETKNYGDLDMSKNDEPNFRSLKPLTLLEKLAENLLFLIVLK